MDEKAKLIKAYGEVKGRLPINLSEVLQILKHPDVITHARAYLQVNDSTDVCQKYQAPWNCVMETNAFAETIHSGWADAREDRAIHLNEIMANWCVSCRSRLFGEDPGDAEPIGKPWLEDTDEEPDNPWLVDCD